MLRERWEGTCRLGVALYGGACVCYSPRLFACGQESGFFQGKTVRIIVGTSPGGGFDVYSRTLARHMGKYTAGNPNFIVENMPGAGPSNRR